MQNYLEKIKTLTDKVDNEMAFSNDDFVEFLKLCKEFGNVEIRPNTDDIMNIDVFATIKTGLETGYVLIVHNFTGRVVYEYPKKCYVNTTTRVIHTIEFIDDEGTRIFSKEEYS